jgi:hypothetical protein
VTGDFLRDALMAKRAEDARVAREAGLPVVERRGGTDDEPPVADLAPGVREMVPIEDGANAVDAAIRAEADRIRGRRRWA